MILSIITTYAVIVSIFLAVSAKRNLQLVERLENIDDEISSALDVLEETHEVIEQKSKLEVFSDEPVVRDLLQTIAQSKDAVKSVARLLDEIAVKDGDDEMEDP